MATAVYERISEDKLGEERGVTRQREDGLALCERRSWEAVIYSDNDISATNGKHRPGYEAMMAAVDRGEIERIVVWHTSRLWRNRGERAAGIDRLKAARVSVTAVKGPELDMTNAYGRGMADMVGAFDSMEVEVKSERSQREAEQRATRGEPGGGRRAFGYDVSGRGFYRCEYDDECDAIAVGADKCDGCEAKALRKAYRSLLEGRSLTGIGEDLNAAGWRTTVGHVWRHNSVRSLLMNARNCGLRAYRGREYPATWPGVVHEDMYRRACTLLKGGSRRTNHVGSARKWLGTGLYLCGRCEDKRMVSTYRQGGSRVYRCKACGLSRRAEPIDALVRTVIEARLSRPDVADLLPVSCAQDTVRLSDEAKDLRAQRDESLTLYKERVITAAELRGTRADIDRRLAEIQSQLEGSEQAGALAVIVASENPAAAWRAIPDDQIDRQQTVIAATCDVTLQATSPGVRKFDRESIRFTPRRVA